MELLKRFWYGEEAVSAVEYAILLAFLALLVSAAMAAFFGSLNGIFQDWATWFNSVNGPAPPSGS